MSTKVFSDFFFQFCIDIWCHLSNIIEVLHKYLVKCPLLVAKSMPYLYTILAVIKSSVNKCSCGCCTCLVLITISKTWITKISYPSVYRYSKICTFLPTIVNCPSDQHGQIKTDFKVHGMYIFPDKESLRFRYLLVIEWGQCHIFSDQRNQFQR